MGRKLEEVGRTRLPMGRWAEARRPVGERGEEGEGVPRLYTPPRNNHPGPPSTFRKLFQALFQGPLFQKSHQKVNFSHTHIFTSFPAQNTWIILDERSKSWHNLWVCVVRFGFAEWLKQGLGC